MHKTLTIFNPNCNGKDRGNRWLMGLPRWPPIKLLCLCVDGFGWTYLGVNLPYNPCIDPLTGAVCKFLFNLTRNQQNWEKRVFELNNSNVFMICLKPFSQFHSRLHHFEVHMIVDRMMKVTEFGQLEVVHIAHWSSLYHIQYQHI